MGKKLFFNFLGADFLAPKKDHEKQPEKQPVLWPEDVRPARARPCFARNVDFRLV